MKTIAFFNNKGGVGKTSLVYHLAWMYADLGLNVVAADLDPQANLTSMFLDDDRLEEVWPDDTHAKTIFGALQPLRDGTGDVLTPHLEVVTHNLALLPGDLALSLAEDDFSSQWPKCLDRDKRAFRVLSALWRIIELAAREREADLVLIDVGPNLGAINRAALISAQHVVIPLAADLYSLQGLRNLGPALRDWRSGWKERRERNPIPELSIPAGAIEPAGYVLMQHAVRLDRPVKAYNRWMERIPAEYRTSVLGKRSGGPAVAIDHDPNCLAQLKHYRSLMPLAQDAHKPMFKLTAADGALGGHGKAVQDCYLDFQKLAREVARRTQVQLP